MTRLGQSVAIRVIALSALTFSVLTLGCGPKPPAGVEILPFKSEARGTQFLYTSQVRGVLGDQASRRYWFGFKNDDQRAITIQVVRPGRHIGLRVSAPEKDIPKVIECDQAHPGSDTECALEFKSRAGAYLIEVERKPGVSAAHPSAFQLVVLVKTVQTPIFVSR